mgnify:CR=1 FL=1
MEAYLNIKNMSNKSSSGARLHPYLKINKEQTPFWRRKKIADAGHPDFRPASEDLPLSDMVWKYSVKMYKKHETCKS